MVDPLQLVKDDVEAGIGRWLTADPEIEGAGFRLIDPFGADPQPMGDGATVAVAWAFKGRHDGDVMGYRPTRRIVDVQGVTLVSRAGDQPQFARFVDWVGGLSQIGVGLFNRPIRDAREDAGLE